MGRPQMKCDISGDKSTEDQNQPIHKTHTTTNAYVTHVTRGGSRICQRRVADYGAVIWIGGEDPLKLIAFLPVTQSLITHRTNKLYRTVQS